MTSCLEQILHHTLLLITLAFINVIAIVDFIEKAKNIIEKVIREVRNLLSVHQPDVLRDLTLNVIKFVYYSDEISNTNA